MFRSTQTALLSFNGEQVGMNRLLNIEVTKSFGKHSIAVADLSFQKDPVFNTPAIVSTWPEWTPVTLDLINGSDGSRWYGYVHHFGTSSDLRSSMVPVLRYTLIGTTLPMNEQRYDSWTGVSRSGVARALAKRHGMRSVIQRVPGVIDFLPQSGVSDWAILRQMADDSGYRLYADGATVTLLDPSRVLRGVRSSDIRQYTQNQIPSQPDSLVKWVSAAGSLAPRPAGRAGVHVISGVDASTGNVLKASSANSVDRTIPLFTSINTAQPATGVRKAEEVVAAARNNARGWVTASAVVTGTPSLTPGSVVSISGRSVPPGEHGYWLVTQAVTRYLREQGTPSGTGPFLTYLELERDQYNSAPTVDSAFQVTNTPDRVGCSLRGNGLWQADVAEAVNVG